MLKIFARTLFKKSRAPRVELEKSVQWWGILIGPSYQLTHPSFMALGVWEHSWLLPRLSVHSLLTHGCMHSARPLTLPFWPQVQRPSHVSGRLFLVYTSDNANGKSRFWPHILHVRLGFAEVHAKGSRRMIRVQLDGHWEKPRWVSWVPLIGRGDKIDSQKVLISM